ncbi:hypothetical protein [Photobacterium indicum]|uniref:hypothetical protein n=1 Tax=Photobacterium indicum TaxID=81447 RepID=UPI003D0B14C0
MKSNKPEAPSWVLPTLIILLITMQLSVRAEDIREPQIDTLYGETLELVDNQDRESPPEWHEYDGMQQLEVSNVYIHRF